MSHIESGTIRTIGNIISGVSKAGNEWKKQDVLIERNFQDKVSFLSFTAFNDAINRLEGFKPGQYVQVEFFPVSTEYKGKWYTDLRLLSISNPREVEKTTSPLPPKVEKPAPAESLNPNDHQEDLPF